MTAINCAVCNQPILEIGTALNGKPVHIKCYHEAKKEKIKSAAKHYEKTKRLDI